MAKEGAFGHTGARRDLGNGGLVETGLGEKLEGGVAQAGAGDMRVAGHGALLAVLSVTVITFKCQSLT